MKSQTDIAIIGIGVNLPGAENLEELDKNLKEGLKLTKTLPPKRMRDAKRFLEVLNVSEEHRNLIKCAYLDEIDHFDGNLFRINKKEISLMDPVQRKILMTTYHALEDAGILTKIKKKNNVGVFMGASDLVSNRYYELIAKEAPEDFSASSVGNISSISAARLSYYFGFNGPNMTIDTSCSSSMVALEQAMQYIYNGECDTAVVGGARIHILPNDNGINLGIEASSDYTKSYSQNSDGTTVGEGVISIIVKRLDYAKADRNHIYAVIKGGSINHNGKSSSITAPNPKAQMEVILDAWKKADIDVADMDFVEGHGTGTVLGDPIEIKALDDAFKQYTNRNQFCAVSCAKSNFGHLLDQSGLLGVVKAVLQMQKHIIYPIADFDLPNQHMNICKTAMFIADRKIEVPLYKKMVGCVNSIGMTGTNVHIVLEEYREIGEIGCQTEPSEYICRYSAQTLNSLQKIIIENYKFLCRYENVNLTDYVHSLFCQHKQYKYSKEFKGQNTEQIKAQMLEFLYTKKCDENLDMHYSDQNVPKGRLISIPLYQFEKQRFWVDQKQENVSNYKNILDLSNREKIVASLKTILKDKFQIDVFDDDKTLFEMGMESVSLMHLTQILNDFGIDFSTAKLFTFNTLNKISDYILEQKISEVGLETKNTEKMNGDIAIVGMDCTIAGAYGYRDYYNKLLHKYDGISELNRNRREGVRVFENAFGKDISYRRAGYLYSIEEFDYQFFNITYQEACLMDPMQRMLLQSAYQTFRDAGMRKEDIIGKRIGVYIGASQNILTPYSQLIFQSNPKNISGISVDNIASMLSGRITHYFDLSGPSYTIDTACSSALSAIEIAVQALRQERIDMAIVGAAHIDLFPVEAEGGIGIEALDGTTHTFSDDATGTGMGEGIGTLLLENVECAEKADRRIHAVLNKVVSNNDGNTPSVTYPSLDAQYRLLSEAYDEQKIERLAAIELHGTGTKIGDAVEFEAIKESLRGKRIPLVLTGVKSNIGHLYEAAGMAGIIKTILSLEYGIIPGNINLSIPNHQFHIENTPCVIADQNIVMEGNRDLIGISSFGFSGTNIHVLLKRYHGNKKRQKENKGHAYLLVSAMDQESLRNQIIGWIKYFSNRYDWEEELSIYDVGCMSILKQDIFRLRVCIGYACEEELMNGLQCALEDTLEEDEKEFRFYWNGKGTSYYKNTIVEAIYRNDRLQLGKIFSNSHQWTSLPQYNFKKTKCWIQNQDIEKSEVKEESPIGNTFHEVITEEAIWKIYSNTFGKKIDENFNYFKAGGDSLTAVSIANEAKNSYGIEVTVSDIMSMPAIGDLIEYLSHKETIDEKEIKLLKSPVQKYYPITNVQKMFYMISVMEYSGDFDIGMGIQFGFHINYEEVCHMLFSMLESYDVFKTSFHLINGEPVMKLHQRPELHITRSSCKNELEMDELIKSPMKMIEITENSLIRFIYIEKEYGDNHPLLLINIHHLIADWATVGLFAEAINSYLNNIEMPLPVIDYYDYAVWNRKYLESRQYLEHEKYWEQKIADYNYQEVHHFEKCIDSGNSTIIEYEISEEDYSGIENLLNKYSITMASFLITMIYVSYVELTGAENFVLGMPVHGRILSEIERTPGLFMNTITLFIEGDRERDIVDTIKYVQAELVEALEHQVVASDMVVQTAINKKKILVGEELHSLVLAVQNIELSEIRTPRGSIESFPLKNNVVKSIRPEFIIAENMIRFIASVPVNYIEYDIMVSLFERCKDNIIRIVQEGSDFRIKRKENLLEEFNFNDW